MDEFLAKLYTEIVNPLITLLFAGAFLVFFWGIFTFVRGYEDETQRNDGKRHMLWGAIGLFIMVAVFGIMRLVASSVGVDTEILDLIPN